jgi:hypothetical protein
MRFPGSGVINALYSEEGIMSSDSTPLMGSNRESEMESGIQFTHLTPLIIPKYGSSAKTDPVAIKRPRAKDVEGRRVSRREKVTWASFIREIMEGTSFEVQSTKARCPISFGAG